MIIAIFIGVAWGIMFLVHLVAFVPVVRVFHISVPYWQVILAVISFSYFLATIGVRTTTNQLTDIFYFIASSWLGIVFLLFSMMLLYELVHLATGFDSRLVLSILLLIVVGLSIYALFAGRSLVTREYIVPLANLTRPLTMVHLSDIHVGTVHQAKYLERVVTASNAAQPDLVLVTGDLFDGSAPINEGILKPLNELTSPSYFSNGNHEEYEGLTKVKDTLANLDMQLLDNKMAEWNNLQIVGVNDRQSLRNTSLSEVLNSLPLDKNRPTILMYHSPSDWEVAREHGVDLMLSGHTHNGQIFPFTLLVRLAFKYINGLYQEDKNYLHVSPGTGTWGPPMRLGSRNQVTILKLVPIE